MKNIFESKVMYADTDAYKVVWHGSYLKWFELGRYEFCSDLGINLSELENGGICFPVVDIHILYKSHAKIFEEIIVETEISEVKSRTIIFHQVIKNKKTDKSLVIADVTIIPVDTNKAKIIKLDENLYNKFSMSIN